MSVFLSLWLLASISFSIIWCKVISSSVSRLLWSLSGFYLLFVWESIKKSRLRVSWNLSAVSRWILSRVDSHCLYAFSLQLGVVGAGSSDDINFLQIWILIINFTPFCAFKIWIPLTSMAGLIFRVFLLLDRLSDKDKEP